MRVVIVGAYGQGPPPPGSPPQHDSDTIADSDETLWNALLGAKGQGPPPPGSPPQQDNDIADSGRALWNALLGAKGQGPPPPGSPPQHDNDIAAVDEVYWEEFAGVLTCTLASALTPSAIAIATRRDALFTEAPIRLVAVCGAYGRSVFMNENLNFVTVPERFGVPRD